MAFIKIDDHTIGNTWTETTEFTNRKTYNELLAQKAAIQAQKAEQIASRDSEIAEIQEWIDAADALDITPVPAE